MLPRQTPQRALIYLSPRTIPVLHNEQTANSVISVGHGSLPWLSKFSMNQSQAV